jgi:hypothetical protein
MKIIVYNSAFRRRVVDLWRMLDDQSLRLLTASADDVFRDRRSLLSKHLQREVTEKIPCEHLPGL